MARQLTQRVSLLLKAQLHQPQVLKLVLPVYTNGHLPFVNSVSQSRMLCKHVNIVDHTCKISSYDEYLVNYKPVKRILMKTLQEILGVTKVESSKIIEDHPQLKKRSRANILNNYYNLIDSGIHKGTIINNIWLLAYEKDKLVDKLDCIKVLNMDNNQLVPWLRLTKEELANYVLYTQQDMNFYTYNRMEYLSYKLECSVQQLCELTVLNSSVMKIPIVSIDKKLNILYEYNVSNQDILKDLWVLRYSETCIRQRCELFRDTGELKLKTWAIRCPLKIISRTIQKNKVERSLMQHYEDISDYLQNKLKVDEETLNSAVKKMPSILRINIAKMDQLIDILHQNGITSNEILQNPRILFFNISTIQNRIEMLREESLIPNLAVLTLAERNFDRHIERNNERRKLVQEHGSVKNYLINKLDIDEKLLNETITKYPSILRVNVKKLVRLIEMLRQNGITGDDIVRYPKIIHFNIETLRKRIEMLKKDGIPLRITLLMRKNLDQYIKLGSYNSKNINT